MTLSIGPLLLLLAAAGDLRPLTAAGGGCCAAALLLSWFGGRITATRTDGWAQGICAFALNVCAGLQFTATKGFGGDEQQHDDEEGVCLTVLSVLAAAIGSCSSSSSSSDSEPPPPYQHEPAMMITTTTTTARTTTRRGEKEEVIVLMSLLPQQPPAKPQQEEPEKQEERGIRWFCWLLAVAVLVSPLWMVWDTTTTPTTSNAVAVAGGWIRALLCADWFASADRATPVSTAAAALIMLVQLAHEEPQQELPWFCAACVWPCVFGTAARDYGRRLTTMTTRRELLFAIVAGATLGFCAAHDPALQMVLLAVHAVARWLSKSIYYARQPRNPTEHEEEEDA